ncbi:hypothetical protein [Candidatus Mycoplasma haematohominis]|uniref:Uncharacterized protein n=1 Tax=Candidatus Mycoplasma haematohominis TaxID=1494318 RepID=A0A478FTY7_9MOLU|nr:hypothetical protein [Candidatus Mycoplasma haemohominis]GCE63500.1 hypothetical protein MHSWG343_04970 [Candidatus Mycoplasma haemohominis]
MSVAKLAVGAGLTAIVVGSGASAFVLYVPGMPEYETIGTPSTDKFGEDFQKHFVDASTGKNKDWWEWSFKYRYYWNPAKSSEFKNLDSADKLRGKCSTAYSQKTKTEISLDSGNTKKEYENEVWIYCSIEGFKPITIEESNSSDDDVYKNSETSSSNLGRTKKSKLISLNDERNNKFWEIQEAAFFKDGDKEGLGNKASDASAGFQTVYKKTTRESADTLKNACKTRYQATSTSGDASEKETLRFCSLQGKQD